MDTATQLMMGVSLAACAGMRAWMPLLVVGLLAHGGYVHLNPSYAFLAREDALIIFGVATALEILGDKVPVLNHFLDAVHTVIRPAAGTILTSSMLTHVDPLAATALGLVAGGGTSLTVHAGKSAARLKTSLLTAGTGTPAASVMEDAAAGVGTWLAFQAPVLMFILAMMAVVAAFLLVRHALHTGTKLVTLLKSRRRPAAVSGV